MALVHKPVLWSLSSVAAGGCELSLFSIHRGCTKLHDKEEAEASMLPVTSTMGTFIIWTIACNGAAASTDK